MRIVRWLTGAALLTGLTAAPARAADFFVPTVASLFGSISQVPVIPEVKWAALEKFDIETGKAPDSLKKYDGKTIRIAAFIVPLEDDMQESDEFLLVPYFGACVHTPPPPANQMVYVKMKGKKTVKIGWWDPVMFEGVIHFKPVESTYGATSFEMDGLDSKPLPPAPKKP